MESRESAKGLDVGCERTRRVGKTKVHAPQAGKTLEEHTEIRNLVGIKDLKAA